MNERLKELIKQAGTDTSGKWISLDNAEVLAELIVRECADVINDDVLNNDGSGPWVDGYNAGATECRRKINQHFGVE